LNLSDNSGRSGEHLPPGSGTIIFQWLVRELKATGFNKTVAFEIFTENTGDLKSSCYRFEK